MSLKKIALVAGLGLLTMTISWLLSDYLVFGKLIDKSDMNQTVNNIQSNPIQFRFGVFGLLIVLLCDLLVAWALYIFFKPVNRGLSLLTAWSRLVYTIFLGIAILNYLDVLRLVGTADYLNAYKSNELTADIGFAIDSFQSDWRFGLVLFGFHLFLLGYLAFRSTYVPKLIGILLILAGLSYLLDYVGEVLSPDFNFSISLYLGWGELVLMFWLLIKGPKIEGPHLK